MPHTSIEYCAQKNRNKIALLLAGVWKLRRIRNKIEENNRCSVYLGKDVVEHLHLSRQKSRKLRRKLFFYT
jgi:hypothetical protein